MKFEDITIETLKLKLKSTEHDFVERKSKSDKGGWLEAAVAFANSAPVGYPAVLFVGADDAGNPQIEASGVEVVIKSVSSVLDRPFPAIYRHIVPLHLSGGSCLAVIIPGSDNRPHFSGASFVRVGTETKEASQAQFELLIADRSSKARKIREYLGKNVTLTTLQPLSPGAFHPSSSSVQVIGCNHFFVTLQPSADATLMSSPLDWLNISFDDAHS